jgi:hypothetical protein
MNGASWTKRNGKSPCPNVSRQLLIMAGKSFRYWKARSEFDSP